MMTDPFFAFIFLEQALNADPSQKLPSFLSYKLHLTACKMVAVSLQEFLKRHYGSSFLFNARSQNAANFEGPV